MVHMEIPISIMINIDHRWNQFFHKIDRRLSAIFYFARGASCQFPLYFSKIHIFRTFCQLFCNFFAKKSWKNPQNLPKILHKVNQCPQSSGRTKSCVSLKLEMWNLIYRNGRANLLKNDTFCDLFCVKKRTFWGSQSWVFTGS